MLEQLLDLGFDRVLRLRAVGGAARRGLRRACATLIVHDVFDAARAAGGGPYDLITCCMTIEHVPDPAQLCRDAHELLAPGGALMLVCHDRRAPLNRALGMRSPIIDIEHLQLFSRASARALLERTGYGRRRRAAVREPLSAPLLAQARARAPRRQGRARRGRPRAGALRSALVPAAGRQPRRRRLPAPSRCARRGA